MDRAKEGYGGAFVELENTNKMFFNSCSFVSTYSFVYFSFCCCFLCCTLGTVAEHVDNVINESINIVKEHDEYCHTEEMVSQDTLSNLLHTSVIYAPRVYAEI